MGSLGRVGFLLLCAGTLAAHADQGWDGHVFTLTAENDAVVGDDRHYTQGARLSYLSADDAVPRWLRTVSGTFAAVGYDLEAQKYGIAIGQEIYTPETLQTSELQVDERPYAGWLYARFTLQRRGAVSERWWAMESFDLDLGVIGPESHAEDTQKVWHGDDPEGWEHQLKSELGINVYYNRQYQFLWKGGPEGWGVQLLPHFGGSAGSISTLIHAGGTVRLGYNIPKEFTAGGAQDYRFGGYIHGGVDGRLVFHNIFLDGNTWRDSHSVTKRPFMGDAKAGFVVVLKRVELGFTYVFRSREFNDQATTDAFGSASLAIKF